MMNSKPVSLKQLDVFQSRWARTDVFSEGPRICLSSVMLLSPLQLPQPVRLPEDITLRRYQVLSRPKSDILHEIMELTLRHQDVCHLISGGPMAPWMLELELF